MVGLGRFLRCELAAVDRGSNDRINLDISAAGGLQGQTTVTIIDLIFVSIDLLPSLDICLIHTFDSF